MKVLVIHLLASTAQSQWGISLFFLTTPQSLASFYLCFLSQRCFLFSSVSLTQSFPSDEGWPFAKYLGACGRIVAVNYVGEELWSFYNAPWEKRVDLARQLMDIAEQLTNNDFEFALYLLDVSFDNFAVGPRDGKVIVVDAENVLVADKRLIKQSEWQCLSLPERIVCVFVSICL